MCRALDEKARLALGTDYVQLDTLRAGVCGAPYQRPQPGPVHVTGPVEVDHEPLRALSDERRDAGADLMAGRCAEMSDDRDV